MSTSLADLHDRFLAARTRAEARAEAEAGERRVSPLLTRPERLPELAEAARRARVELGYTYSELVYAVRRSEPEPVGGSGVAALRLRSEPAARIPVESYACYLCRFPFLTGEATEMSEGPEYDDGLISHDSCGRIAGLVPVAPDREPSDGS